MRDLYLKRNELLRKSETLRELKFDPSVSREKVTDIVEEQNKIYKRLKFYDNFLKIGGKIYGEQIHSKER